MERTMVQKRKGRGKKIFFRVLVHTILILCSITMLVPFLWMILTSFKTYAETVRIPVVWFPAEWNFNNYEEVLMRLDFLRYYGNTILVTILVTIIMMFLGSLSAFTFARMSFPLRNALFYMLLVVFMVPAQMTMIPKYFIISKLGWWCPTCSACTPCSCCGSFSPPCPGSWRTPAASTAAPGSGCTGT